MNAQTAVDFASTEAPSTEALEERISQQLLARGRLKEADFGRARRLHEESGGSRVALMTRIGLVSERDVAYGLAEHGVSLPGMRVEDVMTETVITCTPQDTVAEVAKVMTLRRIRHLPVKEGDTIVGVISIGDVLKSRISEIELEANVLRDIAIAVR